MDIEKEDAPRTRAGLCSVAAALSILKSLLSQSRVGGSGGLLSWHRHFTSNSHLRRDLEDDSAMVPTADTVDGYAVEIPGRIQNQACMTGRATIAPAHPKPDFMAEVRAACQRLQLGRGESHAATVKHKVVTIEKTMGITKKYLQLKTVMAAKQRANVHAVPRKRAKDSGGRPPSCHANTIASRRNTLTKSPNPT
jgi:hypothetical protein